MMYTVLPKLYQEVLARLYDAIDGENYFSGSIAFRFRACSTSETCTSAEKCRAEVPAGITDGMVRAMESALCTAVDSDVEVPVPAETDCRLTVSVIVCRGRVQQPEGVTEAISDLIPVWWEFHTSDANGEVPNDFSFSELKHFL